MPDKLPEVPKIVQQICEDQGQVPWSWLVTEDQVKIVFMNGQKHFFPLPYTFKSKPTIAPEVMKIPARSRRK
jgi:hypothetical protein